MKELESLLLNPEYTKKHSAGQIENLKSLNKKQGFLSYLGAFCLISSMVSTSLKVKEFENPVLQKACKVIDELTNNLIQKFFSERRHLIGHGFMVQNPEYYIEEKEEKVINELINQKKEAIAPELRLITTDGNAMSAM